MYSVYILECENDKLYTGIATDVERRFQEHLSGKGARFTRINRPLRIVYCKKIGDRSAASKEESRIKSLTKIEKLRLIQEQHNCQGLGGSLDEGHFTA